ncbi:5' to 3' exonuclease, 5' flap endonuclease [Malassezia sympodialis ATCC 42132]|uniref:Flap endonuclease 1 n=1 Tax=Malassezia sympodialis (strain ATCC 42132) TaxID=1230383 RepID=A0A1M8A633_MALS4|nr:5' to 3' exonuclease, 5' flap endonuclease [Malassezia sympodialis ATCC 42132]
MGIKGLTSLLSDEAPSCIKQLDIKTLFGRKVAIDASMSLYQFLIAVRQADGQQMMSESGEITSHLLGFFYRTLRMIDYGIKPVYVFDGKPPDLKKEVAQLAQRFGRREEAREQEEEQKDIADAEKLDQLARRQVRPTREHNAEVQRLLSLMGIPWIVAPCEAEAQCAELARAGKVYAAGSEDMDTLTFGTPILLKNLTASEQKKLPVTEINLSKALEELDMPMQQFIDLCMLLGCDYLDPIKGIGPKKALKLIREHKSLDQVLEVLQSGERMKNEEVHESNILADEPNGEAPKKRGAIQVPEFWPYQEARVLFRDPQVQDGNTVQLKWDHPKTDELVQFLCADKGFSEDRVRRGCEKLSKAVGQKQQGRLDGFFTVQPRQGAAPPKRKNAPTPASGKAPRGKSARS